MTADYRTFHQALARWYKTHGRHDLPWRNTTDPYAIYVSEVMLQQTQVKTVLERFYYPFLQRFPTLKSLADAGPEAVLKQWEGLGYYRRAGHLHRAAREAAPILPDTPEALMALPGIGMNTAHAIAAFAYRQPVPVLEANVKRVMARIFALERPAPAQLWEKAWALLDTGNPFDYNQAMMDLGSMLCTPRAPLCSQCPAQGICRGRMEPERYPAAKAKKALPVRKKRIVIWQDGRGHLRLLPRETAFLRGLYGFAEYAADTDAVTLFNRRYALADAGERLGEIVQIYSHFRLEGEVWRVTVAEAVPDEDWYDRDQIAALALSSADKKALILA